MLVQRVLLPATRRESWTVLGDDGPVRPIERYLAYLTDIERSPNTVKAYAHDLKDWFVFLAGLGLDWREVRLEDVAGFVAWLRRPPVARDGAVTVLPSVEHHYGASTVNRKLSALSAFYQHAARNGVDLGELLVSWQPAGRRGTAWRPFLHHITKGQPHAGRTVALTAARKLPRVLTVAEMQAILDACDRLRDRLLFAVLYETGMRIGEALGLRHEDLAAAEREVAVVPRDNGNGARSKSRAPRLIPVSAGLIRLYADYLHGEYGDLDCDYVFVNLWGQPRGHPLGYPAVYDLVRRLRRRTGIGFDPHWCRHTAATRMQGRGVASNATFREKRKDTRPALQLPRPSQRDGRVGEQGGNDLRCHQPVASTERMLHPLLLHPATRMMRQMQRKAQRRGRMPLPAACEAQVFDRVGKPLPTSFNRDVPQEVVRRILDHDSHRMTARYAQLSDTTIRRHWEAARKVNVNGQTVTLDPDGPLAEAAWASQRIGQATQALPNSYCGLPVVKACPHANACLTCPMFITTPQFLPQHQQQRRHVIQILSAAEARGQQRLAEMNRHVLGNLDQIIAALQTPGGHRGNGGRRCALTTPRT